MSLNCRTPYKNIITLFFLASSLASCPSLNFECLENKDCATSNKICIKNKCLECYSQKKDCVNGQSCQEGKCVQSCSNQCPEETKRCTENTIQICKRKPTGCTDWEMFESCPSGQTCQNGKCECVEKVCGDYPGQCGSLVNNCGVIITCGCPSGQICQNSVCAPICPQPNTKCGDVCVNTKTDPKHCGSCNTSCLSSESCEDGKCTVVCSPPNIKCNNSCVNTKTDPKYCGSCNASCLSSESCEDGKCTVVCSSPNIKCNNSCVDPLTDLKHCGNCNTPCSQGQICQNKTCTPVCTQPTTKCNNMCVDINTDKNNCSQCGNVCSNGEVCKNALCVVGCNVGERKYCPTQCASKTLIGFQMCEKTGIWGNCSAFCSQNTTTANTCTCDTPKGSVITGVQCWYKGTPQEYWALSSSGPKQTLSIPDQHNGKNLDICYPLERGTSKQSCPENPLCTCEGKNVIGWGLSDSSCAVYCQTNSVCSPPVSPNCPVTPTGCSINVSYKDVNHGWHFK